jgi:putative ABC transport system permease protein
MKAGQRGEYKMSSILLAWRNTNGNPFRTWTILICAALMAGFAVSSRIIIGGAQNSLDLALKRLGADIIAIPAGSDPLMENAFLMGVPAMVWMPRDFINVIAAIPEVEVVSPQFFLSTLRGATCCSVPEMFLIAYDPETDFTVRPWLEEHLEGGLGTGQAIGGAFVFVPADPGEILIYGYKVDLVGNLEQTGTGIDQSMFFTFETAREIATLSTIQAEKELVIPTDRVSAAMVKVKKGANIHTVARQIQQTLPEVTAVESSNLFHSQRIVILSLLQSVVVLMGVAWILSVGLIGMVFSLAVNERRQEIGVLRALGSTKNYILRSLLAEGLILALAGGSVGVIVSSFAIYLFRDFIIRMLGFPFLFPAPFTLTLLSIAVLAVTLVSVTFGALLPAFRISTMEPAFAMRK